MVGMFNFIFTMFTLLQSAFDTLIDFLTAPFSEIMVNMPQFIQWILPEWLGDFNLLELSFGAGMFIFLIKVVLNFITE